MSVKELDTLPGEVRAAVKPLLEKLPIEKAMAKLVVPAPPNDGELIMAVEAAVTQPAISGRPALQAGLWLYIDELDRSHVISQMIDDATGSYWHGIMHRREGDFGNSHYWFRKAGAHPAMATVDAVDLEGAADAYDAHALVDAAEAAHKKGESPEKLIAQQRREWVALFAWCARQ